MSSPGVKIEVSASTEGAQAKLQSLSEINKEITGQMARAFKTLGIRSIAEIEALKKNAQAAYLEIRTSGTNSADEINRAYRQLKIKLQEYDSEIRKVADSSQLMSRQLTKTRDSAQSLNQEFAKTGSNFRTNTLQATTCLEQMRDKFDKVVSVYVGFQALLTGGNFLGGIASKIMDAGLALEKVQNQMKAMTGTTTLAASELAFIRAEANRLGLEMSSASASFGKFLGATKNTEVQGSQARKIFIGISEGLSAMKLGADETNRAFVQLTQMLSKGKLQSEDLMVLSESLPGAKNMIAQAMGMNVTKLSEQMDKGTLGSIEALKALSAAMHETYGQTAVDSANSAQGAINRIKNEVTHLKEYFASALLPAVTATLNGILNHTSELKLGFMALGIVIAGIAAGAATQALLTWVGTMQVQLALMRMEMTATAFATGGLTAALNVLKVAFASNPVGIIVTALTVAAGAWYLYGEAKNDALNKQLKSMEDPEVKRIEDENKAIRERLKLWKDAPTVTKALSDLQRAEADVNSLKNTRDRFWAAGLSGENVQAVNRQLVAAIDRAKGLRDQADLLKQEAEHNKVFAPGGTLPKTPKVTYSRENDLLLKEIEKTAAREKQLAADTLEFMLDTNSSWAKEQLQADEERIAQLKVLGEAAMQQITDYTNMQRLQLENSLAQIDADEKWYKISSNDAASQKLAIYREQLAIQESIAQNTSIESDRVKALEQVASLNKTILSLDKQIYDTTAIGGMTNAIQEYGKAASDVGAQIKDVFTSAFKSMEDAMVSFIMTGKANFKAMANSIISDLVRITVKQQIMGPLTAGLGSLLAPAAATAAIGPGAASIIPSILMPAAEFSLAPTVGPTIAAATQAGAATGVASGFSAAIPIIGVGIAAAMVASSYFKSDSWQNKSKDQKALAAVAWGVMPALGVIDWATKGALFGTSWKQTAGGVSLGIENGEISGQNYIDSKKKKGMFRGNAYKTEYSALDDQWTQFLGSQMDSMVNAMKAVSNDPQYIDAVMSSFSFDATKINLQGKSAEDQQKAVADYFRQVNNAALVKVYPELEKAIRLGEDATAAFERMNALKSTNNNLLLQELDLLGKNGSSEYMAIVNEQRKMELLNMDATTQAIQKRVWALQDEKAATTDLLATITTSVDAALSAANALKAIQGGTLSTLSPEEKYRQAMAAFTGNTDNSKAGELGQAALAASQQYNASGAAYASDYALVTKKLEQISLMTPGGDVQTQISVLEDIKNALTDKNQPLIDTLNSQLGSGSTLARLLSAFNDAMKAELLKTANSELSLAQAAYTPALINLQQQYVSSAITGDQFNTQAATAYKPVQTATNLITSLDGTPAVTTPPPSITGTMNDVRMKAKATGITIQVLRMLTGMMPPNLQYDVYPVDPFTGKTSGTLTMSDAVIWQDIASGRTKWSSLGLPAFATGTPSVPYDMTANIHQGEIIMDRASSDVLRKYGIPTNNSSDNKETIAELKQAVTELKEQNRLQAEQLRVMMAMLNVQQGGFTRVAVATEKTAESSARSATTDRIEANKPK